MNEFATTKALRAAIVNLETSLSRPYEEYPADPRTDFLNAATEVVFLARAVFADLIQKQGDEISVPWALACAIALGDFEAASHFLKLESEELSNDQDAIKSLRNSVETNLKQFGRTDEWNSLIGQLPSFQED